MPINCIPQPLRDLPQWLLWGDGSKRPRNAQGVFCAKTDAAQFMTFEEATQAAGHDYGLGVVLNAENDMVCIDLDNAVDNDGEFAPWAMQILNRFQRCYTEFSPSGNGLHIFLQAKDHWLGRRRTKVELPGGGTLEVYNDRAFLTVTGDVMPPAQRLTWAQDAFDQLVADYLEPKESVATTAIPVDSENLPPLNDRIAAATKMVMEESPAISGQLGGTQTFRVALQVVRGFCLDFSAAMTVMRVYNATRCTPMWSEQELEHKVQQAIERGRDVDWGCHLELVPSMARSARGEASPYESLRKLKVTDDMVNDDEDIDNEYGEKPVRPEGFDSPGGLLEELMEHSRERSHKYLPEFAFPAACLFLSAIAGTRYEDRMGYHTALYFFGIAKSSTGKTQSAEKLKELAVYLDDTGETMRKYYNLLVGEAGSTEGILNKMANLSPSVSYIIDECHWMLHAAGERLDPRAMKIVELLKGMFSMKYYDGPEFVGEGKKRDVSRPNLGFMGITTPENFWSRISPTMKSDGFLNRFILVEQHNVSKPLQPEDVHAPPSDRLLAPLRQMLYQFGSLAHGAPRIQVQVTGEASDRFMEYRLKVDERHENETEELRNVWSRAPEKAIRLARLLAISDDYRHPKIETRHIEWAIAYINYHTRSTVWHLPDFGKTDYEKDIELVFEKAKEFTLRSGYVTTKSLLNKFPRMDPNKLLYRIVSYLAKTGRVETTAKGTDVKFLEMDRVRVWVPGLGSKMDVKMEMKK